MNTEIEILQNKVLKRAENNMPKIGDVIQQIETEDKLLGDALVHTNHFEFQAAGNRMMIDYGDTQKHLNKFATRQIANRFGIPTPYLNRLNDSDWGPTLAADILNRHARESEPQRLLVRSVEDTVRGVMSDSYKRINSMVVFLAFLQAATEKEAKLYDAAIDETKSFIEVIVPEIVQIETPNNGIVNMIIGAELRNSDFGDGRLNLRTYLMNVVCLNGMIGKKFMNEVHRGSRLPENLVLSQKTYELESAAQASLVTDNMNHLFDRENIEKEMQRVINASSEEMDFNKGIEQLKRSKHYGESELTLLSQKLMNNNPDDGIQGKNTKWKFVQGITAVANGYQTTRRNELIEYASDLMK